MSIMTNITLNREKAELKTASQISDNFGIIRSKDLHYIIL